MVSGPGSFSDLPLPDQVGVYKIEAVLAKGSLTTVYRAHSSRSGVPVCLSHVVPHVSSDRPVVDRFVASARSLLGVQLPHVSTVRDVGEHDGRPFIVTDLIGGNDLGLLAVRQGGLRPGSALSYLSQAASGLEAVAGLGQLHGDVRPGHLLMQRGEVFVVGFGRCVPWQTAQGRRVWGDPAYLAPEIPTGRRPDVRSDIYALGCTFYELLTGRPPFGASPPDALLACHAHEPFPSARALAPQVPEPLDDLLKRMGAKNANQRPQTYRDLLVEVRDLSTRVSAGTGRPPILVVEAGRQTGLSVEIPEGDFLLGRTPGEGFIVDDGRISRRHAILHRQGQRVVLEDLGSRNGVKVNGTRAHDVTLRPGDRIRLGDTVLRVENCEPDENAEPPSIEGMPSSPVRGAFGASEVAHPPSRQIKVDDLGDDAVVPAHVKALAKLARTLARHPGDRRAHLQAALTAAREVIEADDALVVAVDRDAPVLNAKSAEEAQVLSCVLPAVERALPGRLSLLTSVQVGRDGAWSTALAPVMRGAMVEHYLVLVRRTRLIEREALATLELVASVLAPEASAHEEEPITSAMETPIRPRR